MDQDCINAACEALEKSFKDFTKDDVENAAIKPADNGKVLVSIGAWEVVVEEMPDGKMRTFTD